MVLAVAIACGGEFGLDGIEDTAVPEPTVTRTDTFYQDDPAALDVLFVVDDTPSMAGEQAALANAFDVLADGLDSVGVSWQVGVTTTTVGAGKDGWLRGAPYVIASGAEGAASAVAERLVVGVGGSAPEAGLAALVAGLAEADGGVNVGFRRDGATLAAVFVSDADDASEALLGADAVGAAEIALAGGTASALVGPAPSGCSSAEGSAAAGLRYLELVERTGGVSASICEADLDAIVDSFVSVNTSWPTRFSLTGRPIPDTLVATVDGVAADVVADGAVAVFAVAPAPSSRIDVTYVLDLS